MYCLDCGTQNDDLATRCSACGGQSFRARLPGTPTATATPPTGSGTPVGGWLALFCVILGLEVVGLFAQSVGRLLGYTSVPAASYLVFGIWGFVVLASLLSRHPAAIPHTRLYMRTQLVIAFALLGVVAVTRAQSSGSVLWTMGVTIVSYVIWSNYFKRSRRVARTYPGQHWVGW